MANEQFKSFAIESAWVAAYGDGTVTAAWTEVDLVAESTLTTSLTETEITDGDGDVQHVWYHSPRGNVTLRCKQQALRVLELITGYPASSVGIAEQHDIGGAEEKTPPLFRLKMAAPVVNADGTESGYVIVECYKCRGRFDGYRFSETTPGEYTYTVTLQKSTRNTLGQVCKEVFGHARAIAATKTG